MTEYDAFGNPVDQAPLEVSATPAATPSEAPPTPTSSEPATAASYIPRPISTPSVRRRRVNPFGIVALLAVLAVPLIGGLVVYSQVDETIDGVRKSFDSFSSFDTRTSTGTDSGEAPEDLERGSLLRPEAFARGLREIRRVADGGRPIFVRVEAQRIDLQVLRRGRAQLIQRRWDGRAQTLGTASPSSGTPTMRWSRIDPEAPRRLFEGVRNGSTRPSKQLTYAAMFAAGGRWSAFRADGASFTAPPSGFDVERNGG